MNINGRFEHITTIVFDLDDTLRYNDPHPHHVFCDYAETLGAPLSRGQRREAQRWEHRYWASSEELHKDIETYEEGSEAFWLNYGRRHLLALGFPEAQAEELAPGVNAHMRENYNPTGRLHADTLPTLSALRASGYSLGLTTNRPKVIHSEMHALGLDLYMDFYLTAGQLGAYKPRKEIFENLLKFIRRSADEVLYIGDNYFADILGARNAGVQSILLNSNGVYEDVDCLAIRSLSELSAILGAQPVS
ncbi:MAG: HAD family hydrolase [Anaerolineales bacterium]